MPNYDYHCPFHGTFEHFIKLSDHAEKIDCPQFDECGEMAEQTILPKKKRSREVGIPEMFYFEDSKGNIMHCPRDSEKAPAGFVKKSSQSIHEMRKVTSRMNEQDRSQFRRMQEAEQQYLSETLSESHSDMRAAMQGMAPIYQDMARLAMDDNNRRSGPQDRSAEHLTFGYFRVLE